MDKRRGSVAVCCYGKNMRAELRSARVFWKDLVGRFTIARDGRRIQDQVAWELVLWEQCSKFCKLALSYLSLVVFYLFILTRGVYNSVLVKILCIKY